jgi:hypothetical protein
MSPTHAAILSALFLTAPAPPEGPWRTAELLRDGDLTVRLKVKRQATLADREWLVFEFDNAGRQPLEVANLHYRIDSQRDDLKTGRLVCSGGLASGSTPDLFPDARTDPPVAPRVLGAGQVYRVAEQPSNYGSILLRLAPRNGLRVQATAHLWLELKDGRRLQTPAGGASFTFDWLYPDGAGFANLRSQLRQMLATPDESKNAYLLGCLLELPELDGAVPRGVLFAALRRHPDTYHARRDIVQHLVRLFRDDPALLTFFRARLTAGDDDTAFDLLHGGYWHPSLVEPLVQLCESDVNQYYYALDVLHRHRTEWAHVATVPKRLSAVVLRYNPNLGQPVGGLAVNVLGQWASAATMLAKTGNRAEVAWLRPALDDRRVIPRGQSRVPPIEPYLDRTRVCDWALDAILTLLDGNDDLLRREASNLPVSRNPEVDAAVFDRLIADLKKRLPAR